jgi:hypothetical protein
MAPAIGRERVLDGMHRRGESACRRPPSSVRRRRLSVHVATAMLDRLVHQSHVVTIRGDSQRLRRSPSTTSQPSRGGQFFVSPWGHFRVSLDSQEAFDLASGASWRRLLWRSDRSPPDDRSMKGTRSGDRGGDRRAFGPRGRRLSAASWQPCLRQSNECGLLPFMASVPSGAGACCRGPHAILMAWGGRLHPSPLPRRPAPAGSSAAWPTPGVPMAA